MIIKSFYRTPASPPPGNRNAKKPLIREGSLYYHLVESLKRQKKQQRDQIDHQVALLKPITCQFSEGADREYCDILGPVSCCRCIESTNRHIATEIQKGIFPDIEVTLNSLVVPNISKVMKSSENILARKRRLSMINNGYMFRRHETQLRQSDLHRLTTQSTKLPSFSSSERFPNWTSSFMSSRNITSLTMESSV
ncbi:uncharacterized protein LOC121372147 [Gigantopelta aegis]|uniref:uncharacterized protein LOC121372147 n=1 Tax=Gigantopelta aegis TaxID=1735272 RepID=UPI001B887D16|nr:uncharacterized protein LOC121372147 [Gigantopelta aegis]